MAVCLIGFGSNLGDRRQTLEQAVADMAAHPRLHLLAASSFRETPAVGGPPDQPPYLNGAATLEILDILLVDQIAWTTTELC